MVLLDDSFGALPPAFVEGQRIINGMQDILRLFLTRTFYVALLILATSIIGIGLPFIPTHVALLVFMTVAVPTFALALWARPGNIRRQGLLRSISHFVFPAAATIFLFGLLTYLIAFLVVINDDSLLNVTPAEIADFVRYTGIDYELGLGLGEDDPNRAYRIEVALLAAQTALTLFTTLAGLILVIYVEPPIRWFVGGDVYSGDWRPTILALALMLALIPVNTVDSSRRFFQLLVLPGWGYGVIIAITLGWALTVRYVWRRNLFERFLGLDEPLRAEIDLSPQAIKKTTLITLQVQAVTMTQEAVPPVSAE
jgi:cation-transporting ATPase E